MLIFVTQTEFMRKILGLVLILLPFIGIAQKLTKADKVLIQNVQNHIKYLASDELEGRRAGSVGEQKAVNYIVANIRPWVYNPWVWMAIFNHSQLMKESV